MGLIRIVLFLGFISVMKVDVRVFVVLEVMRIFVD